MHTARVSTDTTHERKWVRCIDLSYGKHYIGLRGDCL